MQKIKFCWEVLKGRSGSWVFFILDEKQQMQILNKEEADLTLNYIQVDKKVMEIIASKLSR